MTIKNSSIDQGSQITEHSAFGHKLRFWRNQKRMSQLELAWAAYEHLLSDASRHQGDERMKATIAEIQDLLCEIPKPESLPDSPSILTRLNMSGEILETTTMIAHFGPVNDVFVSKLRVEMIFPANKNARMFF